MNVCYSFPASVLKYLAMCHEMRKKINGSVCDLTRKNLPLVSNISGKMTPEGTKHAHLSFLKY